VYLGASPLSCASCHGANAAAGKDNLLKGANNAAAINNAISSNKGGMIFYSGLLSSTDINNLAAFLATPGI
jgi:mono/diheme cytochrome c family protein